MPKDGFLINLGDLSKPATVLVEKISDALGGYFKPYQIKRVAKAEAEAEIIKAQAQIEVTELQRRTLERFVAEEAKKQENIEKITEKAIPELEDSAKPQNIEDDWITNFFDKCRIISDNEMQSLWAKVLSGEGNSPGSYSKRTVNLLSSLDKSDAHLFTSLCGFGWLIREVTPLIFDFEEPVYNEKGINFDSLTHLDDIGLVSLENVVSYKVGVLSKKIVTRYFGTSYILEFKNQQNNDLNIGKVVLTKTGEQLCKICGSKPVDGFTNYVFKMWEKKGITISSPDTSKK